MNKEEIALKLFCAAYRDTSKTGGASVEEMYKICLDDAGVICNIISEEEDE